MSTILLIDDSKEIRDSIHDFLEEMEYHVKTASNGVEALKIYKKESIDLVITDLLMPEKDGVETIIELKKINPTVKVIAISGGGQISGEDHLQLLESLNIEHAFFKPIDTQKLLAAIEELLG